jgi:hypothetical protein
MQPEDRIFVAVEPSAVEVEQIEKLCQAAAEDERPVVLLMPRLEDAAIVGIGYAARQLRDRFIKTLTNAYYIKPLSDEVVIYHCFPEQWQVWQAQDGGDYQVIAELPYKPLGDQLDTILMGDEESGSAKASGIFSGLQRFMRTLSG